MKRHTWSTIANTEILYAVGFGVNKMGLIDYAKGRIKDEIKFRGELREAKTKAYRKESIKIAKETGKEKARSMRGGVDYNKSGFKGLSLGSQLR